MQSSIQTCTLYRQQSVSRYYFLSYLPKTCFISKCQDFAGDWYRWAAHCCSRANSIRTRYLWCSWRCCRGQRCLAYKKAQEEKHRHFWRLGKVIFYHQLGWLQVETFELLLHFDLRFGCDPYHTTPVGSFASRSVQLRSGIYRRGGTDRSRESCAEFRYWIDNFLR